MKKQEFYTNHMTRRLFKRILIAVGLLLIVFVSCKLCTLYGDYLEIHEIGVQFTHMFWKRLCTKLMFSLLFFAFSYLLLWGTTSRIRKNLQKSDICHSFLNKKLLLSIICAIISVFAAYYMGSSLYEKYLAFKHATPFQITDPIFGLDLSYYVFKRPFLEMLLDLISTTFSIVTLYSILVYIVLYLKIGERNFPDLLRNKPIMVHVVTEILALMLLFSLSVWFDALKLLTGDFMDLTGGGFTDINIWLKFYSIAPFLIISLSVFALLFLKRKKYLHALISGVSYIGVLIIVSIAAWLVQIIYVAPNEVSAESPYIEHNIYFTRFAYNLSNVQEYEYPVSKDVQNNKIITAHKTLENIRIIDFPATITATNQLQGIRGYYYFNDMNVGLYTINGQKKAVAVGAREIDKSRLEASSKNYVNEKFRYTHGFGIVMAEMDQTTEKGQPIYLIEDLIPQSAKGVPTVTQPRIYFGQLTEDDVIVNTKISELDYSEGTSDVEFNYDGTAGIPMHCFNRLLFAFRTGDFRMLVANQITENSKLLTNRNILQRVKTVAPFLKYDTDPSIVIDEDGTLKWIIDGYTTTDEIPYSQYTEDYNYIRNSFKVIVDAYTGETKFYITDRTDPLILTYEKIYPELFEKSELPKSLRDKTKYPEALFKTQCEIYTQYHTTNPFVFYNKNDMYAIANEKYAQDIQAIEPYYVIMQLDAYNTAEEEMILMLPFTLINRENMVSWIAVGNEGENYGKLMSFKFPKNSTVYGPLQIENMIDNDPDISKELTLWDSGGSNVIRGNMLVIPIENQILYVEPVYITSDNQASLPLLKRMIVGCDENIVMAESLEAALSKLFTEQNAPEISAGTHANESDTSSEKTAAPNNVLDTQIAAIAAQYERVEQSVAKGDWITFGEAMEALKQSIENLKK